MATAQTRVARANSFALGIGGPTSSLKGKRTLALATLNDVALQDHDRSLVVPMRANASKLGPVSL
jgi:hypothetical protein